MQHTPYFKHNQNKIQKQNKQANIKDASINLVVILTFFSNNCDFGHNNEKNPANIWKINEKGWGGKTMIKCFFFFYRIRQNQTLSPAKKLESFSKQKMKIIHMQCEYNKTKLIFSVVCTLKLQIKLEFYQ